jgi:enoyl-CoA hydratase/carnithine racemase
LRVDRRSPSYCRVTFDHPPINTITATTVAELAELVGLIEQDPDLNVVVFDSLNPDF